MYSNLGNAEDINLATHALQFVFLGHNGFRFPVAHWPTLEIDPATLYIKFWTCVRWLLSGGFKVHFCCCDGGTANRSFIKLHFQGKDPVKEKFTTVNPYTREALVFIMDPFVSACELLRCSGNPTGLTS